MPGAFTPTCPDLPTLPAATRTRTSRQGNERHECKTRAERRVKRPASVQPLGQVAGDYPLRASADRRTRLATVKAPSPHVHQHERFGADKLISAGQRLSARPLTGFCDRNDRLVLTPDKTGLEPDPAAPPVRGLKMFPQAPQFWPRLPS
jgi:hypothetical protein